MKAAYRTANGQITFEVDGESAKALFSQIASIQEVFDAEHACGMCDSTDIRYLARKVDDFDFYELACRACHARFAFGQAKKGGALFPKRKDEDGNWIPNNGWTRFEAAGAQKAPARTVQRPGSAMATAGDARRQAASDPPAEDWGITDADIPAAFRGRR